MPPRSEAERVARLCPVEMAAWFADKSADDLMKILSDWAFWERHDQRAPPGNWASWLVLAGRSYGKTRMGAEWVRARAEAQAGLTIALVGSTAAEARNIMVEGHSGLLRIAPAARRPQWEPSLRKLTWDNGTTAHVYSAAEPDGLRGPEHHFAWCDEIAKWDRGEETWDNLAMTLRLGTSPQVMATTTPRPVPLVRRLLAGGATVVTRGRMEDNHLNLPITFIAGMRRAYGHTRFGRQELDGDVIDDIEGALWSRDLIECCRVAVAPLLTRTVVAVDPPAGIGGNACGIVVAGLGEDGDVYVVADHSVAGKTPEGWARVVAHACTQWQADRVVAEGNQGGAMVESILRAADVAMPIRRVFASTGKIARAEPVSALYETARVHHVGSFPALEDELCGLIVGGGYQGPGKSPDRADALVWAVTELALRQPPMPRVRGM